jgi:hypothetical protein
MSDGEVGGGTTAPVPLTNLQQIVGRIEELQAKLQVAAPGYEGLLHTIHVALQKDDELAHLLTPEQVGVIVSGLARRKNIIIAAPEKMGKGNKAANGKKLSEVGLGDL